MKEINRELNECVCTCDNCGQEEVMVSTYFNEINRELRYYGWITRKIDGEWKNFCCHKCLKEYLDN